MPASGDKQAVVNVYGKTYTLALEPGQSAEQIGALAELVHEGMCRVRDEQNPSSPIQVAVLAGMNLVEELFRLQSEYHAAEADIQQRASRLTASLGRLIEDNIADLLHTEEG